MVKLDVVTGFLGAGKTTLINKLLAEAYAGEKPVLIENEFGEASIDDSLIADPEVQVRLLSSGCICCTLKGDFVAGIVDVVERYAPSRIVIEPTGLADPDDIVSACSEAGKSVPVELNAFITVANAENLLPLLIIGGELFHKQISEAKLLILNRTDLTQPDELAETLDTARRLNPGCMILEQGRQSLDALSILAFAEEATKPCCRCAGCNGHEHGHGHEHEHEHGHSVGDGHHDDGGHDHSHEHMHDNGHGIDGISSLAFYPDRGFSAEELEGLCSAFKEDGNGRILRAKGFLKKEDGGFAHLEYVYGRGELLDSDYAGPPKLVLIGNDLDEAALANYF